MISEKELSNLLGLCIVPKILELSHSDGDDVAQINRFFESNIYSLLINPKSALWHLSPVLLASLYSDELAGREVIFPEEQS